MFSLFRTPARRTARPRPSSASLGTNEVSRPLRDKVTAAIASKEYEQALLALEQLERQEPTAARWAHKRGDVLRLLQRNEHAFAAYATAVYLYAEAGDYKLAGAMAKTATSVCPSYQRVIGTLNAPIQAAFHTAAGTTRTPAMEVLFGSMPQHADVIGLGV